MYVDPDQIAWSDLEQPQAGPRGGGQDARSQMTCVVPSRYGVFNWYRTLPWTLPQGIISDQTMALSGFYSYQRDPVHLRRIRLKDPETGKTRIFLTNLCAPPAARICTLYKAR